MIVALQRVQLRPDKPCRAGTGERTPYIRRVLHVRGYNRLSLSVMGSTSVMGRRQLLDLDSIKP